ncbi:MAG: hypothetical protein GVY10_02530 [Verrucomicrobia bacterium]|nr:hypothetical protein [Verrucomicrobiota bacterium]
MEVRSPQPPANHMETIAYVNGRWVMGDARGNVSNSVDGETWVTLTTPYGKSLEDIAFYNGVYLVLGADNTTLLLSSDLVNWEWTRPENFPFNPNQFLEAFGYLYVVGWSGSLCRTQDLVTWEEIDTGDLNRAEGIAFNGSRMVMVGASGEIMTSEDGTSWTLRQEEVPGIEGLGNSFLSVHWANEQFLAGGKDGTLMTSPDGIEWTLVETPTEAWIFMMLEVDGTLFFPGRNGEILRTENLEDWETIATGLTDTIYDIGYDGETLLAVGRGGGVARSTNGSDWDLPLEDASRANMLHLAHHGGTYLATAANGLVFISNDSEAWIPVFEIPEQRQSAGLVHFLGQFTLVTNSGAAYTSPDGETWTEVTGPGDTPNRIRVIDDRLWTVGLNGEISWTTDLVEWTATTAAAANLTDIAKGPEGYVVASLQDGLFWSADGSSWNSLGIEETRSLRTTVYFQGHYFAFGFPGFHWKSRDGMEWSLVDDPPQPFNVQDYVIVEGRLVLPGYLGRVDVSTDGESWESFTLPTSGNLQDIVITPNRTVALGGRGSILSSPADIGPGFAAWRDLRFNLLQRLDPELSGPDADPDNDRLPNLLEYLSNSQPLIADLIPPVSFGLVADAGSRRPFLSYRRSLAAGDVLTEVEVSADGKTWHPATAPDSPLGGVAEETIAPFDTETDTVSLRFASTGQSLERAFVRLRLSLSEEE